MLGERPVTFLWVTVGLVLGLAFGAAILTYQCLRPAATDAAARNEDSLLWLRREFQLTPEQLARIEKIHTDYQEVCAVHCSAILDSRTEMRRLEAAGATAAAIEAARLQAERVDAECRASTEAHIRAVADLIGGEQGERYLKTLLPRISRFDHESPPDLRLNQHDAAHDGHPAH